MRPYIQEQGLQPTKANLVAAYTGRVRSNIHMVLCMRYMQLSLDHAGASGMLEGYYETKSGPRPGHHAIQTKLLGWSGCCATGL